MESSSTFGPTQANNPMSSLGAGCPCKRRRLLMEIQAQEAMRGA
jgi:hypothetical protein